MIKQFVTGFKQGYAAAKPTYPRSYRRHRGPWRTWWKARPPLVKRGSKPVTVAWPKHETSGLK